MCEYLANVECRAKKVLEETFPDRKVVAVPTRKVLVGGGNIHCITCQQPAANQQSNGIS